LWRLLLYCCIGRGRKYAVVSKTIQIETMKNKRDKRNARKGSVNRVAWLTTTISDKRKKLESTKSLAHNKFDADVKTNFKELVTKITKFQTKAAALRRAFRLCPTGYPGDG
jgi:hypothetical protein